MEYREQFELLMAPLKRNERVMLESIFLNGLQEEIQAELKLYSTVGLQEVMYRALLIEEKNAAMRKGKESGKERSETSRWKSSYGGTGWDSGRSKTFVPRAKLVSGSNTASPSDQKSSAGDKKQNEGRKLSSDELRDLSKKGLCFKCGERWGRDHVCKMKHYQIEIVDEEEGGEEEEEVFEDTKEELELKSLQLSLKSKEGLTSNQSFTVWGRIGDRVVLILIDSGASTNFISYKLVEELQLKLDDTAEYTIEVGNGEKLSHKGVCVGLKVHVQGIEITQNFFLMTLGGTEMVLGMDWLASLGDVKANFKNLSLKWRVGGQKLRIRGEPSLSKHQTSFKTMVKAMQQEEECYILSCCPVTVDQ